MNHCALIIFSFAALLFLSCERKTSRQNENLERVLPKSMETNGISIKALSSEMPEYPDAILEMLEPSGFEELNPGEIKFIHDIKNFQLASGNHIFMILNNDSVFQSSNPVITANLNQGNYLAVSFLCLPNHISLKNYGNYVIRPFKVGKTNEENIDDTLPMIFYNYPSGRIKDENNGKLMIDFFLANTTLSATGHKVKVELSGQEFILTEWVPVLVEGLKKEKHHVRLTLLDEKGRTVNSPFHSASGSFILY